MSEQDRIWVVQQKEPGGEWETPAPSKGAVQDLVERLNTGKGDTEYRAWPYVPVPEVPA